MMKFMYIIDILLSLRTKKKIQVYSLNINQYLSLSKCIYLCYKHTEKTLYKNTIVQKSIDFEKCIECLTSHREGKLLELQLKL